MAFSKTVFCREWEIYCLCYAFLPTSTFHLSIRVAYQALKKDASVQLFLTRVVHRDSVNRALTSYGRRFIVLSSHLIHQPYVSIIEVPSFARHRSSSFTLECWRVENLSSQSEELICCARAVGFGADGTSSGQRPQFLLIGS